MGCETATKALTKAEKSAEEIAQVQAELKAKAAEVSSLQAELEVSTVFNHVTGLALGASYDKNLFNKVLWDTAKSSNASCDGGSLDCILKSECGCWSSSTVEDDRWDVVITGFKALERSNK